MRQGLGESPDSNGLRERVHPALTFLAIRNAGLRAMRAVALFACFLAAMPALAADDAVLAFGARIAGDDARSRIVIDLEKKIDVAVHYVTNPPRVIVDLPRVAFGFPADQLAPRGLLSDIRYGTMDADSARLVLTARKPVELTTAKVQVEGKDIRLVLDAVSVPEKRFQALAAAETWRQGDIAPKPASAMLAQKPATDGAFVIAVDAGHGGIDAGAIGADSKTEEKNVTLAFARGLVERLNREPGIKAVLTREDDRFLSLSERVQIAREKRANLFVSLHADTLQQNSIRGATVYTISDNASDGLAAALAKRENLSDEIAGIKLGDEPAEVADILLDLTRRETQAFSIAMARSVVGAFEGQIGLINNPHRYAGFRVLQAPDVPSILLELGFLSNPEDEKLLLDEAWRAKVADLLAVAVRRYREKAAADGG